ncbi:MAG: hypothetical protein RJQ04_17940 [Longimicrobiales bacterium]
MSASGAGYSGTPLGRKLGIKEGHRVATLGAPDGFAALLDPLPASVDLVADPADDRPCDVIIAFVPVAGALEGRFARGHELLDPYGGLWIAWPKQSSALATEFRESDVRAHGLATGLVDNKICAVDADWSGLRFVVRTEHRPPRPRIRR